MQIADLKIVGICGKKRAGKDSLYNAVSNLMGVKVERIAFGDMVKGEVASVVKFFEDTDENLEFMEAHKERFRPLLQWWGTEYRRHFYGSDYWIDSMRSRLHSVPPLVETMFITDVRFPDEIELVRDLGGKLIRVDGRGDGSGDSHSSEVALDHIPASDYDYIINNTGDLSQLAAEAELMLVNNFCRRVASKEKKVTTDNNDSPHPSPSPV